MWTTQVNLQSRLAFFKDSQESKLLWHRMQLKTTPIWKGNGQWREISYCEFIINL